LMKCVVNWIPLRIRVRSRNTQPHLNLFDKKKRTYTPWAAQEWTNRTLAVHERTSVHFLVLPGSFFSITEITEYRYFSPFKPIDELKQKVSKILYQWTLLLNTFCFCETEYSLLTTRVFGHIAIIPFFGGTLPVTFPEYLWGWILQVLDPTKKNRFPL